jgi:hypothetical protein
MMTEEEQEEEDRFRISANHNSCRFPTTPTQLAQQSAVQADGAAERRRSRTQSRDGTFNRPFVSRSFAR